MTGGIGWYVHHVGSGHLHRATAVAQALPVPVTGLSSLPRPDGWAGDWVELDRDDDPAGPGDVTAGGRLHWAPPHHAGLSSRMATTSAWLDRARPGLLVSDVSVEVALLARLHGVPVATLVMPGRRDDPAHLLGYDVSDLLVAAFPATATGMLPGLPERVRSRVEHVGGLSRFSVGEPPAAGGRRVALVVGQGGGGPTTGQVRTAQGQTPDWEWTVLGGAGSSWVADPLDVLRGADVVVCAAGQNSVAEVAALRRPAVVVPVDRPHDEQRVTAHALARGGWPAVVVDRFPDTGWDSLLDGAARLDGGDWATWCDGGAADRFAALLLERLP